MSRFASLETLTISLLAAGAAVATFSLVAGRREALAGRPVPGSKLVLGSKSVSSGKDQPNGSASSVSHRPVLPIAFWDAAELDGDDHPASSVGHDVLESDAWSGGRWLARVTQAADADGFDDLDDPAEIAADSVSMISQASRAAALREPEAADEADELFERG